MSGTAGACPGSAGARPTVRSHVFPRGTDHPGYIARDAEGRWIVTCSLCAWVSSARPRLSQAAYDYAGHANEHSLRQPQSGGPLT